MAEGIKTEITDRDELFTKQDIPEFDALIDYTDSICAMCVLANEKWRHFLSSEEEVRIDQRLKMMFKLGHIRDTDIVTLRALLNLEACSIVRYFTKEVLQDQIGSNVRDIVLRIREFPMYADHDTVLEMVISGYGDNDCFLEKVVRNKLFTAIYRFDFPLIRDYLEKSRRAFNPRIYMTDEF